MISDYKDKLQEWKQNKEPVENTMSFTCDGCDRPVKQVIRVNDGDNAICFHCWIKSGYLD